MRKISKGVKKNMTKKTKNPSIRIKKGSGEALSTSSGECSDVQLETKFLLMRQGRLFVQTVKEKESMVVAFGRLWKPITQENKSVSVLCGTQKPTDGLYKIEGKKVVRLL